MMMMTMMVVVVREDASIFINRAVDVLYFSDVHSVLSNRHIDDDGGDSGWKTVAAVYNRWSFGLTDPFLYSFFANDSLHHRITDRVHQRDGANVWASLTASLSLRPSTTLCFPQIPPYNYHIFTRTPMYSHKFSHDLSFIPTTLHQMTKIQWTTVQRTKNCTMRLELDCATLKEDLLFNGRVLNIRNQNISNF